MAQSYQGGCASSTTQVYGSNYNRDPRKISRGGSASSTTGVYGPNYYHDPGMISRDAYTDEVFSHQLEDLQFDAENMISRGAYTGEVFSHYLEGLQSNAESMISPDAYTGEVFSHHMEDLQSNVESIDQSYATPLGRQHEGYKSTKSVVSERPTEEKKHRRRGNKKGHQERSKPASSSKIMQQVGVAILDFLSESHRIGLRSDQGVYTMKFRLDWNPLSFARKQEYSELPDISLPQAITLTGSRRNAQALTARQYLAQTWPNTGNVVMDLFANAVRGAGDPRSSGVLPGGAQVTVELAGEKLTVIARGFADALVEIGQQFAWLGAALQPSPYESGVATCVPVLERLRNDSAPVSQIISIAVRFNISQPFSRSEELLSGACWHPMFRNPVMVNGYPIRSRPKAGLGLEMPLDMMGELSGSTNAHLFDGKIFVKGFSTMLIATKQVDNIIVWHYFYNDNGKRLSYLDHTLGKTDDIDLSSLDSARHLIGWCEDCRLFTGDPVLSGNVRGSKLPRPRAGCVLEKVNLSLSNVFTGGVTFAVGVKDLPPHLIRNGYIPKLKWLSKRYVVLWDEEDKRGWLVNGTSALLHIVRASLHHSREDEFSASFLFDERKMVNGTKYEAKSASQILSNPKNLELEIYPGQVERFDEEEIKQKGKEREVSKAEKKKSGYYLFGDLAELRLTALEQIMDHQERAAGKNGINMKTRMRTHLEGWDFFDIATDEEARPRVATLQALGYGWVDFVRSIGAITLLGKGFGEIIQPSEDDICPKWEQLPTGEYYLAMTTSDLMHIMNRFGNMHTEPKELVPDLAWHCPDDLLAVLHCHCLGELQTAKRKSLKSSRGHRSPVQVPFPVRSKFILPLRSPEELHEDGAVIFGHPVSWKYRWSEDGRQDVKRGVTSSGSQSSPSESATHPVSMDSSVGRSDRFTSASTGDDRARRLRREKRSVAYLVDA